MPRIRRRQVQSLLLYAHVLSATLLKTLHFRFAQIAVIPDRMTSGQANSLRTLPDDRVNGSNRPLPRTCDLQNPRNLRFVETPRLMAERGSVGDWARMKRSATREIEAANRAAFNLSQG